MGYLKGFVPWIVFAALSSSGWQWAAPAALLAGCALLVWARRAGIGMDALVLEYSTVVYFAALSALALTFPGSPLQHYSAALSFGWLAATAWGGLAAGRPFTLGIARRRAPREVWDSPVFARINLVLTSAWALSFTLTAAALTACIAAGAGTLAQIACPLAGFCAPALFTARYPATAGARLAAGG